MKLTAFCMLAFFIQISAKSVSQTVTLSEKNVPFPRVFKEFQKQTGYSFLYNYDLVEKAGKISVDLKNVPLKDALDKCLENSHLSYGIVENTVVIKPRENLLELSPFQPSAPAVVTITGKVTDEKGNALSGVSVIEKGTKRGTSTGANGDYELENVGENAVLVFSFIGYKTKSVLVNARTTINISLKLIVKQQDEVVVVGYGTTKRKDLAGSVSSVNVNEVKNTPFVSIDQALAGKAAGVNVTQSDGSPGSVARIRIRGGTSLLGGNDPLYIIDGVQVQISNQYIGAGAEITNPVEAIGGSSRDPSRGETVGSAFGRGLNTLAGLNINDIETIDILKDASATAIYGSRAANGVVIITTKKGRKNEKPLLEANYYFGLSNAINEKVLNADQYRQIYLKGAQNLNDRLAEKGLPADASATAYLADPSLLGTANIDWLKLVTRTGQTQNVDISVRGGGTASSYYMSLGYNKSTGTLLGTDFSRISGKINLISELTNKIRVITNLDLGFTVNNITNGLYGAAVLAPPTFAPYNPDGTISAFPNAVFPGSGQTASGILNPFALLNSINRADNNSLLGSLALEYDILKSLKFRSSVSANYGGSHQVTYEPSTTPVLNNNLGAVPGSTGVGSEAQSQNKDLFFENTLTWDKQFNQNSRLNILGGTSWQKTTARNFAANGQTYPDNTYLNGLSSAAVYLQPSASQEYASLLSFYMRANYILKERYILTLTGRSDASSKFPPGNRIGYFPSFGVAWRIKEENFLKNVKWLSELKLRASAGYTGTQNIGNNTFYTLFTPAAYAGNNALVPSQLGNDDIKWENTLQKDLGIDISLFDGRLNSSIGYYEKFTKGLLLASAVPLSTGFSSAIVNKADITNKGLEIEVRGDIINSKNVNWSIGLNISGNRSKLNKINRLLPSGTSIGEDDPVFTGESIGNNVLIPGESLGQFFGAIYLGPLLTQEQVTDYVWDPVSNPNGSIWTYFPPTSNTIGIGSPRYQTYGNVDSNSIAPMLLNRTSIGSASAKFFGGMTQTFSYKRFSLIANITYSYGGQILYLFENNALGLGDLTNRSTRILLPTYQDDPTSKRPILYLKETNTATGAGASTLNVFDASYIKLKSINLSYSLPESWMKKAGIKTALVYVSASNILTITKYPGPDPELSNDPYSIIGGNTDDASYPQSHQYTFGVRFTF